MGRPGDWQEGEESVAYVTRAQLLRIAVELSRPIEGNIIEFGVWEGASTRVIRDTLLRTRLGSRVNGKRIYACDSFEGLAEAYEHIGAGTFKTDTPNLKGVRIVKGYFEDTLTPALAKEVGQVSFAHFDADLYSSTKCALEWVAPLLHTGSLLQFDEFGGEDPAECRAFLEWSKETGIKTAFIGMFARQPSGKGDMTDRRALFQVISTDPLVRYQPSIPARALRKLRSLW